MKISTLSASVVAVFLAASLCGQTISRLHVIPVVAHTSGLGDPPTYWVSDVTIHNPTDAAIVYGMLFYEEGVSADPNQLLPLVMQVGAQQTVVFADILASVFGYNRNVKGALAVDTGYMIPLGNTEGAVLLITSRTYNTGDPRGTYGQTVSAAELFGNFYGTKSFLTGVRHDDSFRSNMGIVNLSPVQVTVHWAARILDGTVVKTGSQTLPGLSMRQWTFASLGFAKQTETLSMEFWLDPADVSPDPCAEILTNGFIAYVSKVDGNPSGTGDGEHIHAIPSQVPDCWLEELF